MDGKQLASPYLEGGGGYNFEHRVQAYFLLLMLSNGKDPIFDRRIVKLNFQARHHGRHMDDLVCYTDNDRKLLVQVKHSVSAVKSNNDFVETIQAAWRDFNSEDFDTNCDRMALVTANISPKTELPLRICTPKRGHRQMPPTLQIPEFISHASFPQRREKFLKQ